MAAICADRFAEIEAAVVAAGYGDDIEWSENCEPPKSSAEFAREAIFVICNSGMKHTVAQGIFNRVMKALRAGESARTAFGHEGKAAAIDQIWRDRDDLYLAFFEADDKLEFCRSLPWIGKITQYHLAKNFGVDVAKPDVHLQRLADAEQTTPQALCDRLAKASGYRSATVDVILWRACATGILNSRKPKGDDHD